MESLGILLIRLLVGLSFAGHGAQKVFGMFGGHGLQSTGGFFESLNIKPGKAMALVAGLSEIIGGLFFAAGFLTPLAALLIVVTMIVAIVKVHGQNGFWSTQSGYEYNAVLIVVAVGIALTGPGKFALDYLIF
ncbi:DoxX family protein [Thalassobacillus sp. CUG 92003]|uniref:DoxX family protein n=1 Tax=Thalassobacillus sp. CUG 92003 TaxID=2736641 RepID=UPI0015E6EA2A|nr:DoxX family protein [Thalassobacillus sp. CUG 92003]